MKKTLISLALALTATFASAGPFLASCNVTDTSQAAVACFSAPLAGNDANGTNGGFTLATQGLLGLNFNAATGNVLTLFPFSLPESWKLIDKSDSVAGTQTVTFTSSPTSTSGDLDFSDELNGWFAITLKAGPGYNAYLFNGNNVTSIEYSIDKRLSHASLWAFEGGHSVGFNSGGSCTLGNCDPVTPIPEPGTLALFGLGLAGIAAARRVKK